MKLFSCSVTQCNARTVDITPGSSSSSSTCAVGVDAVEMLQMSLKFSFLNLSDHIEDLRRYLGFECLLLCEGVLVATAPVKVSRT